MSRSVIIVFAMLSLLLFGVGLSFKEHLDHKKASDAVDLSSGLPFLGVVPDLRLIAQDSSEQSFLGYKGKILVINFMFTSCQGPCPMMSARLKALGAEFSQFDALHLISISVDPQTDTPRVLKEYAKSYQANPRQWTFFTGEKSKITRLAIDTFKLAAEDASTVHSTRFILVDQKGRIRGMFDSEVQEELEKLRMAIRVLSGQQALL